VKSETLNDLRLTLSQVRDFCSVAIGTVHKWVDRQDLESKKDGRERTVALNDLLAFLAARYTNNSGENRARLAAAQADRAEFENKVRIGEFMPIKEHGNLLRKVVSEISGQMAGFPGRVAGKIAGITDPAVVRTRLVDECNAVRDAVADHLDSIALELEGEQERSQ
jgi:phage terminase Nu1 subunit (DNA packaging protein)